MSGDWKHWKDFPWPYKDGMYGCLSDPKYLEDRHNKALKSGNGWMYNDGKGWEMNPETAMAYQRRRRKERGE